jgi:hypothetical protein
MTTGDIAHVDAVRGSAFHIHQPDGTKLKVLGTGNQHQATFKTVDGYTVVRDPVSGFYQYAQQTDAAHPMPSGARAGAANPRPPGLAVNIKPTPAPSGVSAFVSPGLPRSRSRWQTGANNIVPGYSQLKPMAASRWRRRNAKP